MTFLFFYVKKQLSLLVLHPNWKEKMRTVKVLLCQPMPTESSPQKNPPLGIMFAGAAAEKQGFQVDYWDERWDSPELLGSLISEADVVGVSSFTGIQLRYARQILIRAKKQGKVTLFGGIHANLTSDQCLQDELVDYVAVGEGEITLPSFLKYFSGEIAQPLGIKGHEVKYFPAPMISSEDFISPITEKTLRFFSLANQTNDVMLPSSRGCPYSCGFCVNSTIKNSKYRVVDAEVWLSWLDELLRVVPIKWLQVGDDYLGNQNRILRIGRQLHERGIQWNPSFRADNFKKNGEEFAFELKRLGVTDVSIGVETGSARLMEYINKGETKEEIVMAAKHLSKAEIRPRYYFIVGFPTETRDEMHETLEFADELYRIHKANCNLVIYNFTPFPGISLYPEAVRLGMEIPKRLADWEKFTISNSGSAEHRNLFWIGGLHFHQQPGSKTDLNFPGWRRLLIWPFERLCDLRWRHRWFKGFALEKLAIELLLKYFRKK